MIGWWESVGEYSSEQGLQTQGRSLIDQGGVCMCGNHFKNVGYGYCFNKNFKNFCGNKWENYIYNLICVFNNLQDFEKGNGIKLNYKNILSI